MKEIDEQLFDFFNRIFFSEPYGNYAYKVLLSRNCFSLYKTVANRVSTPSNGTLMTDSGLLSRSAELAGCWEKDGVFPGILILSDAIYHGRTVVSFLSVLEKQLMLFLPGIPQENIRHELAKTVRIESFLSCGEPTLLYKEYRTWTNRCFESQCDVCDFRKQYQKLIAYISSSDIVNTTYTISARLPKDAQAEKQLYCYIDFLKSEGYRCYSFADGTRIMLKCLPDTVRTKAIFSVRILERRNSYWIVPYIFTAEFDNQEFHSLTRLLMHIFDIPFRGMELSKLDSYPRVQCELTSMMLNHLLLQHTLSGAGLAEYTLDSENLNLNFGGDQPSRDFLNAFLKKTPAVGGDLRKLMKALPQRNLENPLPPKQTVEVLNLGTTKAILERYIYSWSTNAERVAYYFGANELTREMVNSGHNVKSFSDCLQQIFSLLPPEKWYWDIRRVTACLLDYMDRGYISVSMYAANANAACCHYIRISEASLSLLPQKNRKYLPLLIFMEQTCLWGWERMKQRIDEYFGSEMGEQSLASELWLMTKTIHQSGQSLQDWCNSSEDEMLSDPYIETYKKWARFD